MSYRDRDRDDRRGGGYDGSSSSRYGGDGGARSSDRSRDRPRERDSYRGGGGGGARDRSRGREAPRRSEGGDSKYGGSGSSRDRDGDDRGSGAEQQQEESQPKASGAWDPAKEALADPTWARIYISNLPADVTSDELQEMFGAIGVVAREKQKRGYKDQWPFKIKIYTDAAGQPKGDAVLTYEDSNAARTAPEFFNGADIRGKTIKVELAGKPEPPVGGWHGGGGGGGGGGRRGGRYGGGGDRYGGGGGGYSRYGGGGDRDFRDRPDRRSRPY
ncbi:tbp-associated factor 15b [Phytophthora cinnamomi]|uniref:tbp-associated factor 15b n=1 Tax=Phytophthora cinnamomi TaxID=4785 RepID=UPI00355A0106|nr:tbp-associated factor 15b [Phytophthora cinnamomi]